MAIYQRLVQRAVETALADTRVVHITGPRQSGKTTLAEHIAGKDMPYLSLDDELALQRAQSDPVGFLRDYDQAVIDEIQLAPALTRAIKLKVDRNQTPGQFLLTGSADLMTLPRLADSLAGRMETIRLLPLSQAEIRGGKGAFLDTIFEGGNPDVPDTVLGQDLVEIALAGGYPPALLARNEMRRWAWYRNYVNAVVQRDVQSNAQVGKLVEMPKLLQVLAEQSGQVMNSTKIGSRLGMNHVTTRKYIGVLEAHNLLHTLQPWYTNKIKGLSKSPKIQFLDSGLLASLVSLTAELAVEFRGRFGPVLESFVYSELLKIASWSDGAYEFSYMRNSKGKEVDLVVENHQGNVVGIEVKASANATPSDFAGLRMLREACGNKFVMGIMLLDHHLKASFGDRLIALPISSLWS